MAAGKIEIGSIDPCRTTTGGSFDVLLRTTVTDENLNPYGLMHTSLQVPDMKCRSLFYNIATGCTLLFNKPNGRIVPHASSEISEIPRCLDLSNLSVLGRCLLRYDTPHLIQTARQQCRRSTPIFPAKLRHKLKKLTNSAGHTSDEVARATVGSIR